MVEEKEKIVLLESHKIFLSLEFFKSENEECLTSYGKGLLNGLLDPATSHKIAVIPKKYYDEALEFEKKYNDEVKLRDEQTKLIGELNQIIEDYDKDVHKLGEELYKITKERDSLIKKIRGINKPKKSLFGKFYYKDL